MRKQPLDRRRQIQKGHRPPKTHPGGIGLSSDSGWDCEEFALNSADAFIESTGGPTHIARGQTHGERDYRSARRLLLVLTILTYGGQCLPTSWYGRLAELSDMEWFRN